MQERKFERASEDLPHDCINILRAVTVNSNPIPKQTTILYPTDLHESGLFDESSLAQVIVTVSGTSTDVTGFGSVIPVSVAERFRSFYVDWDNQNKQWKGDWYTQDQLVYQFVPDIDALRDAILE